MALKDQVVGYWKFDESSGNASDSSGNSNTLVNNNTVGFSAGLIGNGADFTRASSRYFSIVSGSQTGLGVTGNAISINVWHKGNANINNVIARLVWRLGGTGSYGFQLSTSGNSYAPNNAYVVSLVGTGGGTDLAFGTAGQATDGTRRMITATYDGTNIRCYINGTLVTTSGTLTNYLDSANAQTLTIGATSTPSDYLDGQLDELAIWSRAITGTEISTLYNSGSGLAIPFSTAWTKTLTESATITDLLTRSLTRTLIESLTITDVLTASRIKLQTIIESLTITDALSKGIMRTLSEAATITDTVIRSIVRSFAEVVTVTGSIARSIVRTFTESSAITDKVNRSITRVFNESATLTDTLSKGMNRYLSEVSTITDTITRTITKTFTETVSIVDTVRRYINGLLAIYSDKYSKRNSSYNDKYSPKGTTYTDKYKHLQ